MRCNRSASSRVRKTNMTAGRKFWTIIVLRLSWRIFSCRDWLTVNSLFCCWLIDDIWSYRLCGLGRLVFALLSAQT
jgi:hypothetical protein